MASNNPFGGEGSSINRPPMFNGDGYAYWKARMKIFIQGVGLKVWDVVENGPFIPTHLVNGLITNKPMSEWTEEEERKVQYDFRAKNIITSALSYDEFFRVSTCETAQEMWDTLEVTHEGTSEVKRSRMNTLTAEYELFRMNPGESVQEMQKRFTMIVNQLIALGKKINNEDLINKILRCLSREWQPKVTAITESRNLATMTLPTLFGKLQEHESELKRLTQHEDTDKKKKGLALKVTASKEAVEEKEDDNPDDEHMSLLVKRFGKFLRKKGNFKKPPFPSRKPFNKEGGSSAPKCYECGKTDHMKMECPQFLKRTENSDRRIPKDKKGRRAYIAWEDNDSSSSEDSDSDEEVANLCLMAGHNSEDDEVKSDFNSLAPSYDELQDAFEELHEESMRLSKLVTSKKKAMVFILNKNVELLKEIEVLKNEIKDHGSLKRNTSCDSCIKGKNKVSSTSCKFCKDLVNEVEDLKNVLANFTKGRDNLNALLGRQRCFFNRAGLGYQPGRHQKLLRNIFVPASTSSDPQIKCFYCGRKGHSASTCNTRKVKFVNGKNENKNVSLNLYGTNSQGPKKHWVPKTKN